ncbi:MAG: septum formation protein Maf [Planctomycetes bacterium]|nr:septum formation protein Maf [Planctomycetota bacterium]MCB9904310.1 septum formation protein Maf [Planctomycetota bacterium]
MPRADGGERRVRLILASASPRRRDLLDAAGLDFDVEPSGTEEVFDPALAPEELAVSLALQKAAAVAALHAGESALVIGSDTVVAVDLAQGPRVLGKPEDESEAREMLRLLSGTRHRVVTGVCVVDAASGESRSAHERTFVTMRAITSVEVEAYVASQEWRDKAGGYAIQENADAFVTRLDEGGFDNVVGLPVELTLELLRRAGASLPPASR